MPRPRPLLSLLAALLCVAPSLSAQENPPPSIEWPLHTEWAWGPSIVGGGRLVPTIGGLQLSAMYVGQERGLRFGLIVARDDITDPVPASPAEGIVRARNGSALFVERLRVRRQGRLVIITGYGLGVGSLGYEFDNTRNTAASPSPDIDSWAPAVTASADVAWHFLFIGVRSALLLGVQRVSGDVPGSGAVPSKRGIGHIQHLVLGTRFPLFND